MEEAQERGELTTLNCSVLALLILIAGVLLSFSATVEQRDSLARALCCRREDDVDVFPKRWTSGLLIAGMTGFFAWLSCRATKTAQEQGTFAEQRSARANLLAAALVFAAAVIRLEDLSFIGRSRESAALEETLEPQ